MEEYIKNGIIRTANRIIIIKDNMQIINPTKEEILADGWVEYIPKPVNPDIILKIQTQNKVKDLVYKANVTSLINTFNLTDKEALTIKDLFPMWDINLEVKQGERYFYNNLLWECIQEHTTQESWKPSLETASLWKVVEVEHEGTQEDPIPYNPPMEIFKDKYYIQDDILYLCTRNSEIPLSHKLNDLINLYVVLA